SLFCRPPARIFSGPRPTTTHPPAAPARGRRRYEWSASLASMRLVSGDPGSHSSHSHPKPTLSDPDEGAQLRHARPPDQSSQHPPRGGTALPIFLPLLKRECRHRSFRPIPTRFHPARAGRPRKTTIRPSAGLDSRRPELVSSTRTLPDNAALSLDKPAPPQQRRPGKSVR